MSNWQAIETAPRNKMILLGKREEKYVVEGYSTGQISGWRHGHSGDRICFEPDSWMPLPEPPK